MMNIPKLYPLRPQQAWHGTPGFASNILINSAGRKIGYKYYPESTYPITKINAYFGYTGNTSSVNFKLGVFTDDGNQPSSTQLGGYTPTFAGPSSTSSVWTGELSLSANTGNLTINVPVWIVCEIDSGTPDGSNYMQGRHASGYGGNYIKCYNGTDWTTITQVDADSHIIVIHSNGDIGGHCGNGVSTASDTPNIYKNGSTWNFLGTRYSIPAKHTICGVLIYLSKIGTPSNLNVTVYADGVLKTTQSVPQSNILSAVRTPILFSSSQTLSPGAVVEILLSNDNTNSGNYYDIYCNTSVTGYESQVIRGSLKYIFGSSNTDPSSTYPTVPAPAIDVSTKYGVNGLVPLISDPFTDLMIGKVANPFPGRN